MSQTVSLDILKILHRWLRHRFCVGFVNFKMKRYVSQPFFGRQLDFKSYVNLDLIINIVLVYCVILPILLKIITRPTILYNMTVSFKPLTTFICYFIGYLLRWIYNLYNCGCAYRYKHFYQHVLENQKFRLKVL